MDAFQIDGILQDVTESLKNAVSYSIPLDLRCFKWEMLSLSSISLLYRSQLVFFRLMLERCCIKLIVMSICKLMMIGRWFEPRFVFVCQLVDVIGEADALRHQGNLCWHCPGI